MKKIILLMIVVIATFGCNNNILDTAPYDGLSDVKIWNSEKNATMVLNGVYSSLALGAMLEQYYYVTNIGPDGFAWVRTGNGLGQASGLATSRDAIFLNQYSSYYKTIRYANDVIKNLSDNTSISEEITGRLIGEAKFLRGLSYFYLWNFYGGVIILDKPTDPSDTYLPRNTAEEVKNFIINDFTEAIDKLPVSYPSSDNGRATKGAAIAMLGKTYLFDKQWRKAAEQFEKLMKTPFNYDLVADYASLFNYKTQINNENIFTLQYIMVAGYGSTFDMRYGCRSHNMQGQEFSDPELTSVKIYTKLDGSPIDWSTMPRRTNYSSDLKHGQDLIPWYEATFTNVDKRLHNNIVLPGSTLKGIDNKIFRLYYPYSSYLKADPPPIRTTFGDVALLLWRKYVTTGTDNSIRYDSPVDNLLIRYADVLLMYAEAKNEAEGPSDAVLNAVNKVRLRSGIVSLPGGLSKEELRLHIWKERFRELMAEGHLYFDVKRWRTAHTNDPIFGLNHDILDFRGEKLYTKVFKEKDYLWPIPAQEIELNPNLTQNPEW